MDERKVRNKTNQITDLLYQKHMMQHANILEDLTPPPLAPSLHGIIVRHGAATQWETCWIDVSKINYYTFQFPARACQIFKSSYRIIAHTADHDLNNKQAAKRNAPYQIDF